jgi:TM2 domain-containing membrane protein YozV
MKCSRCGTENQADSKFCYNCSEPLNLVSSSDEGIRGRPSSTAKKYAHDKNSTTALLLSLIPIPGIGQFYNGDVIKGLAMLIGSFVLLQTSIGISFLIWIWAIVDAYQVAKGNWELWQQ